MKSLLLTLLSILTFFSASAQELTVKSFVQTTDAIARTRNVMGTDGNVCAAVVVRIPSAEATFNGGFILNKPTYKDGEYILDMQTGAAQMRVSVPGYNTIDVKFRDYIGSTLQSKTTYLLTINMPQAAAAQKKQTLNIKVTPSDAIVLIDGEVVDGNSVQLSVGTHKYSVAARGYYAQEGTVEVKENSPAKLLIELDRKQTAVQNNTQAAVATQQPTPQPVQQPVVANNALSPQTFTVNGVSFTMIPVEGGTFTMGATAEMTNPYDDEKPIHQVTLSSYSIGETEVTQALWQTVMGNNPSFFKDTQNPVEQVSWNDCQKFIKKLNKLTGKKFRLPTEAEWEFAARGGNMSRHTQYSGSSNIDEVAWYYDNSSSKTHHVKTKNANELGIYDMSGNVYEWCQDWSASYSGSPQINPTGPTRGFVRVLRGGTWKFIAGFCSSSIRNGSMPGSRLNYLGFRLALSE